MSSAQQKQTLRIHEPLRTAFERVDDKGSPPDCHFSDGISSKQDSTSSLATSALPRVFCSDPIGYQHFSQRLTEAHSPATTRRPT